VSCETSDYRIQPDALKDPGEDLKVELSFFDYCANFWRSNVEFATSDYVRPTRSTGYAYTAQTGGLSGAREPVWPRAVDSTIADGSVTWKCVTAGAAGLSAITSPTASSDPTGLTISAVSVDDTCNILATYSGGVAGQDYDAVFTFTLGGVTRVARQAVKVRKR